MKKALFLAIVLVLAVGIMTGCRRDDGPPAQAGAVTGDVGAVVDGVFRYHEPVRLRALYAYDPSRIATEDTNRIWMLEWARHYMNIDIEVIPHSFATANDIFQLIMASGDYVEAFFFFQWNLNGLVANSRWGDIEEVLVPLQDYLFNPEIMPNLSAILDEFSHEVGVLKTCQGNIFQMVTVGEHLEFLMNTTGQFYWVDVRVLEALGREMPRTLDDFIDFLRDVRDTDPMGLGAQNVPLGGTHAGHLPWKPIFNALGWVNNGLAYPRIGLLGGPFIDGPGELVCLHSHPLFFEFLEIAHMLMAEGLLDQDFFVHDAATSRAKAVQDFHAVWPAFNLNELSEESWRYYHIIPPLTSHHVSEPFMNAGATQLGGAHYLFVTYVATPLQREALMRFADLNYCPDFRWVTYYGPEYGVHQDFGLDLEGWQMVDGARILRDVDRGRFETRLDMLNHVGILHNGGNVQDRRTDGAHLHALNLETRPGWWWYQQWVVLTPYFMRGIPPAAIPVEYADWRRETSATMGPIIETGIAQFITGARPLTLEEFEAWNRELDAVGRREYVELNIRLREEAFRR